MKPALRIFWCALIVFTLFSRSTSPVHADWSFDAEPPVTTLYIGTTSYASGTTTTHTNQGSVDFTLTCTDALSGCETTQYNIDGAGWTTGTSGTATRSSDGSVTVLYRSTDYASNVEADNTHTFTFIFYYTSSGTVFVDQNADCVWQSATEPAYTGSYTITSKVTSTGSAAGTVTNGANGAYTVSSLLAGTYTQTLASYDTTNYTNLCGATVSSTVPASQTDKNFGLAQKYTISGSIYRDVDNSGTINGDDLFLESATPTIGGTPTTTSTGSYSIAGYINGSYTASMATPTGFKSVIVISTPVTVSNANATVNFLVVPYTIQGTVYMDVNDNSVYNAGTDTTFDEVATISYTETAPGTATGSTSSSASNGTYTITNIKAGSYTISITTPTWYKSTVALTTQPITVSGDTTGINFLIKGWSITGTISIDYNHNAALDAEDIVLSGATISLSGGVTTRADTTTTVAGLYSFVGLKGSLTPYTVTFNNTTAYTTNFPANQVNPRTNLALDPFDATADFKVTPLYTIQGNIYVDQNKNWIKDGESNYGLTDSTIEMASTNGNTSYTTSTGLYTSGPTLLSGIYLVSYTSLPSPSYEMTYPAPPQITVTIGKDTTPNTTYECSIGGHNAAVCDLDGFGIKNGNISSLNFGITNSFTWGPYCGMDVRTDGGITNRIPATSACGTTAMTTCSGANSPGIAYSGNITPNFGAGTVSDAGWVVYDTSVNSPAIFTPINAGVIRGSYDYYITTARQSGITPKNMNDYCTTGHDITDCIPTLSESGVYKADGDLAFNPASAYTFPAGKNIVILVNGNLTISQSISVPVGATAWFAAKGSITIASTIGADAGSRSCTCGRHIQGMYSAGTNFTIAGTNDCTSATADKQICIEGSVVGAIQLNRDLCGNNDYPTIQFVQRPDFIINAPAFIQSPTYIWQEVAP